MMAGIDWTTIRQAALTLDGVFADLDLLPACGQVPIVRDCLETALDALQDALDLEDFLRS